MNSSIPSQEATAAGNAEDASQPFIPSDFMKEKTCSSTVRLRSFKDGELIIPCNEIVRIEAAKAYSYFFLANGRKVVSSRNLNYHVKTLDPNFFFRAHKSHIINLLCVKRIVNTRDRKIEMVDGSVIDYSRRKAEETEKRLAFLKASKN